MTDLVAAPSGASGPSPETPGLDLVRLRSYLERTVPGLVSGELSASLLMGGKSNLTYLLTDGPRRWVVRRPPLGHVLATAHDMAREYRVLTALGHTGVPVPGTVLHCADPEVLGAPFYVMDYVAGEVYRSPSETGALGADRSAAVAHALVDVLVRVHHVDPAACGLADFGRPDGFLERQTRRWKRQFDASHSRTLPGVEELHAGLAARIPETARACLLHGDYRLDNVVIGADGEVAAVLDWEMSTLGDPLADLGLFLVYYSGLGGSPAGGESSVACSPQAGFPSGAELVARYAERSPVDLSRLDWYVAFAFYKLAAISEGIYFRHISGQTVGGGFDWVGESVAPLLAAGAAALDRDRGRDRARARDREAS